MKIVVFVNVSLAILNAVPFVLAVREHRLQEYTYARMHVTKTRNGERAARSGQRETGNGEWKSGNE